MFSPFKLQFSKPKNLLLILESTTELLTLEEFGLCGVILALRSNSGSPEEFGLSGGIRFH